MLPSLFGAVQPEPSPALQQAVDEFRIQTSHLGGSASNDAGPSRARPAWHGRIYENLRNDFLDAVPHEIVQRDGQQRKLRRNQFGFNVTGPVYIPKLYNGSGKTFVTFSFEGMRESIGQSRLNTIPTVPERTGDWSHTVDAAGNPLSIYDPASTALNPGFRPDVPVGIDNLQYTRQQFPGNRIPLDRLDAAAQRALGYYPEPNANAGPFFQNNYFVVSPEINRATGFIATVDHTFDEKHRLTVRVNHSNGVNGSAAIFPTIANPNNPPVDITNRGLRIEHIFTESATNINSLSAQADSQQVINQSLLDEAGKPFPRYQIDGYQNMGVSNPVSREARNNFRVADTFATRWKNHRFSIGEEITHIQINAFRPQFPEGHFQFTAGLTSLPGVINTGHGFASFLLGEAAFAEQSVVTSPSYFRWNQYRTVFSDQWQATPSLTLTLGANLETYTQRIDKYDRQSNISFLEINPVSGGPGALVEANRDGYGRSFSPTWTKVEPSLGIAWSVLGDNNTVLRLNYDRRYGNPQMNSFQFGTQAFNGNPVWLSANQQLTPAAVLANGLPDGPTFPDLRPQAANGTVAHLFDTSNRQPTAQNFRASIQRQLAAFLIFTAEYEHQYRRNQFVGRNAANPNAIPLSGLAFRDQLNDLSFSQSLRPFPQYQDFEVANFFPAGLMKSDSIRLQLEKRTSGGLALNVSYRYSRQMDNFSQHVQDYYNLQNEWALSSFNNPHQLSLNYIYELPLGPGKSFLASNGWTSRLLGGWAVSGVANAFSGSPISLRAQFNNTGGVVPNLRADVVPGVDPQVSDQGPEAWFNAAAFTQPADFSIGSSPRTLSTLRNPGGWNTDLTLSKRFGLGGDRTLESTASLFNALNHANWNAPDTVIGPATAPNVNAGHIIGSSGGRIVQLGLRINF